SMINPAFLRINTVITALVAVIHVLLSFRWRQDVDGRDKPGHDGEGATGLLPSSHFSQCRLLTPPPVSTRSNRPDRRGLARLRARCARASRALPVSKHRATFAACRPGATNHS